MAKVISYNPFKMWGSWIGLVFGLIGGYFSIAIVLYFAETGKFKYGAIFVPLIVIILGFLIGWGIHSLIRSLKK